MCGIAGIVDPETPVHVRQERVEQMCTAMLHRGPDDGGIETHGPACIGMRRLAIFDPANGHQPMSTADGRLHLVFNGAIYNFRDLRHQLEAEGQTFRTQCDTEVLLGAYAQWGAACVAKLRGMFAFAVWDSRDEVLFLARDAFGIKPLYYRHVGEGLLFASELNALLASGAFSAELDPLSVADYLGWFAVPAPRTIYRGIFSLRPGESATFRRGQLHIESTWSFRSFAAPPELCRTEPEFRAQLRDRLNETIRAHAVADVPVGAFLSGGLDSAVIVGLMSQASSTRLKTFSIGFAETAFDESDAAADTARHFGTDHHRRILTGAEVAADLPKLLCAFDQPTGDGINTYYVSETARAGGVTVALSGLGGDELLGGYPSFQDIPRLARWLPLWWRMPDAVRDGIGAQLRKRDTRWRKLADILQNARSIQEVCSMQRLVFSEEGRHELLNPDLRQQLADHSGFHPALPALSADLSGAGLFETVSAWELRTYMADVLLRDSDVMSMRHSLELRVPFVDRNFVEWLWHQPARFKDDRKHPKSALAAAAAHILPPGLPARRKRGFTLPFADWMRTDLRDFLETTFSNASVDRSGLFSRGEVQRFWSNYLTGHDSRQWSRVWSLAVLIDFANRRSPAAAPAIAPARVAVNVSAHRTTPSTPATESQRTRRRTLLLAPELFASEGGIPRILQIYLKALCDLAGPRDGVRFVALNDGLVDSRDLRRSSNQRLTDWRVCNCDKTRFVRGTMQLSRGCERVICGHVAQLPVALLAKMLNRDLRYYLVAHGIEVWRPFTLAERMALRGAERIFCVSEFTRRELLSRCSIEADRAVVLHNALDPYFDIGSGLPRAQVAPVILMVARVTKADRYKGVEQMVAAMPAVREQIPAARLRIIGRGDDVARLTELRDQLGMRDAIDFLGFVDDRRMTEELRSCSVFALPSKKEGFGLVFLEAMANGRPCVGARAGGIPEVVTPETGLLVEFGDVPALAAACVDALRRPWNEAVILDRARHFSYDRFKQRLADLLQVAAQPAGVPTSDAR